MGGHGVERGECILHTTGDQRRAFVRFPLLSLRAALAGRLDEPTQLLHWNTRLSHSFAERGERIDLPLTKDEYLGSLFVSVTSLDHASRGAFLHVWPLVVRQRSVRLDRCEATRRATRL